MLAYSTTAQIKIKDKNIRIKERAINTKTDLTIRTVATPERIDTKTLKELKPSQIVELPAARIDRDAILNLKVNESWTITPSNFSDKDMRVAEYFGEYKNNQRYISVYPENKYYARANNIKPRFLPTMRYLVLKFNPEIGQRYRMIIKLKPGEYKNKKVMTRVSGNSNDTWYINHQYHEVMFDFIASSKEIKISPIIAGSESYYKLYEPLEIRQINIDKVEE